MPLKEQIHEHCRLLLNDHLDILRRQLNELSESVANETTSTAGDKYETARAMLHIQQEQLGRQLAALQAQELVLTSINPALAAAKAALGSLVKCGHEYYYLSIGLGKMQVNGHRVVALSLQSPLGSRLKGLAAGDRLVMNGKKMVVEEVV